MKHFFKYLPVPCVLLLLACNRNAPSEYFRICVAESNHISQFGSEELREWFDLPPARYNKDKKTLDSVGYAAIVREKIAYNEDHLAQIRRLKVNADNKEIVDGAIDVYNYVLQHQKKEYLQLAQLRDDRAPAGTIDSLLGDLDQKYKKTFEDKLNLLWGYGTQYANRHDINLNRQPNQQ